MIDGYYEAQRDSKGRMSVWNRKKITFGAHFHGAIELTYVVQGIIRGYCNRKQYEVKTGELVIFPSYSVHSGDSSEDTRCVVMLIPLDYSSSFFSAMNGKTFHHILLNDRDACEEIYHCMQILVRKKSANAGAITIKGYVNAILGTLIDTVGVREINGDKIEYLAKDILIYLQENFLSPITLDDISARFGYSKYSFSHLFNSYFHCSMTDYINSMRVRYAANLLSESDRTMTEIAMEAGFESLRTFYRVFKKYYEKTPSEYKKRTTR